MQIIQQIADEKIREAMAKGEFADLPGRGRPYRLDGYLFQDPEQRVARKLLKDHNFQPLPLTLRKKIEKQLETIEEEIRRFRKGYARRLARVVQTGHLPLTYPPEQYWHYPEAHKRFVQQYLPIWRQVKQTSRFATALNEWQHYQRRAITTVLQQVRILLDLIGEYEAEVVKLCIQERDFFRLETGFSFKQYDWWEQYVIELFPPIEEAIS